jgi:hypothetical protein
MHKIAILENVKKLNTQTMIVGAIVCLLSFLAAPYTHAQEITDLAEVSVTAIPTNPNPGQTVSLNAQSFSIDLSQANLTWTYGGKTVSSGRGNTQITVTAPASGSTAIATVTVSGFGLGTASASVMLNPGSVDMLWEATDSYTPAFYKGKALLSVGGSFRVTAIPAPSAPRSTTFSWSRNGSSLQSSSGLNRSSILLQNTIFNKQEGLGVAVYGGTFQGNGSVSIPTQTPSVIAYQKRQGFVDFTHGSAQDIVVSTEGTTLHFEPYFFSVPTGTIHTALKYNLKIGEEQQFGDPMPNELRISKPKTLGTYPLSIEVATIEYSVQRITEAFNLIFR